MFDDFSEFIEKLAALKEWGVIAFLLVFTLYQAIVTRKDRKQARKEELEKDAGIDALLNARHEQFKEVFTKAVNVLAENKGALAQATAQLEDLEAQVDSMDKRCDERQTRRASERRRAQP